MCLLIGIFPSGSRRLTSGEPEIIGPESTGLIMIEPRSAGAGRGFFAGLWRGVPGNRIGVARTTSPTRTALSLVETLPSGLKPFSPALWRQEEIAGGFQEAHHESQLCPYGR